MGLDNRRWPTYTLFALCILLTLSLLSSWSMEADLKIKLREVGLQLQESTRQYTTCMGETQLLTDQRESYANKAKDLKKTDEKLKTEIIDYKSKVNKLETEVNRSVVDVELCKTELQSLKNLQLSKSATLETLRLEKDTLATQLSEKKDKIESLEKEIEKLKSTFKAKPTASVSMKVTPAVANVNINIPDAKLSSVLNAPINEPALENAAHEENEDANNSQIEGLEFENSLADK